MLGHRRCEDESIDELAAYLGSGEAVAALTKRWATHHGCPLRLSVRNECLSTCNDVSSRNDVNVFKER